MGGRNEDIARGYIDLAPPPSRSKHWFARALRSLYKHKKRLMKDGVIRRISPARHGVKPKVRF